MSNISKNIELVLLAVSALLVISILSQNKGSGLSNVFGGGSSAIYRTKRGFEKWLFYATIVLAIIFVALSIAAVLLTKV